MGLKKRRTDADADVAGTSEHPTDAEYFAVVRQRRTTPSGQQGELAALRSEVAKLTFTLRAERAAHVRRLAELRTAVSTQRRVIDTLRRIVAETGDLHREAS